MRNTIAKRLRAEARLSSGGNKEVYKANYKQLKKEYKFFKRGR